MKHYRIRKLWNTLEEREFKTASGYEVWLKDVQNAVAIMDKKHFACEWVDKDMYNYYLVDLEGYFWLEEVYFNHTKKQLDADVIFFEWLIENYVNTFQEYNLDYEIPPIISKDMTFDEFAKFVNRKRQTVQKKFYKLPKLRKQKFYYIDNKKCIDKDVLEDLCRKHFKQIYLKYLENVYIDLRELLWSYGLEVYYGQARVK